MKISVITPTGDRQHFLHGTYQLLKNQTYQDWEWLIYDTSLKPMNFSDPRVTYVYDEGIVSIGEKRNRLIAKARGDAIVHFDDDDYYASSYLETVAQQLKQADFFNIHSWFSYDVRTKQIYYWATDERGEVRYFINSMTGSSIREIELGPYLENQKEKVNLRGKAGYGFSFAYTKELAKNCPFLDIDIAEDRKFLELVEETGYSIHMEADRKGEVVHVFHDFNTSGEYPQYRIPYFLIKNLFTNFFSYIHQVHEN